MPVPDWKERGFTAEGWAIALAIRDVKSVLTDKELSGKRSGEPVFVEIVMRSGYRIYGALMNSGHLDTEIDTGRIDLVESPKEHAKRHIIHANDVERVTFG